MKVDLEKRDLIKLCLGLTPPYGGCDHSEFCSNQWNEDWKWKDGIFDKMTESELIEFYMDRRPSEE